jgi:hypothetical protein
VRIVRAASDQFTVQLNKREWNVLSDLLRQYPVIPPAHHRLSKTGKVPDVEINQRLLDEAIAEQRAEHQKQARALLTDPRRREDTPSGPRFALSSSEMEWLLQVLNDIRVGHWILLGSPERQLELLNQKTAPHVWAMEMSGLFQMHLLEALQGGR